MKWAPACMSIKHERLWVQSYAGNKCMQCAPGFYPWFDGCKSCPEPFGWTPKNTFTVIYRYGIILVLWIAVNRVLCERLQMMDAYAPFPARLPPRVGALASVPRTFGGRPFTSACTCGASMPSALQTGC